MVEKGRIGDSIPHLSFFDLRARYYVPSSATSPSFTNSSPSSPFSVFLQDAGRCFGYRATSPVLALNHQGHQLLLGNTCYLDKYLMPTKYPICQSFLSDSYNASGADSAALLTGVQHPQEEHNQPLYGEDTAAYQSLQSTITATHVSAATKTQQALFPSCTPFIPDPSSMWHRVLLLQATDAQAQKTLKHVKTNRILLLARSQIGKTGAFIKLIELVLQEKVCSLGVL